MKIDFKIERNENCVLIDSNNWLVNDSNKIQRYRISGRNILTYITEALDVYPVEEALKGYINPGDTIFLTRVASEISNNRGIKDKEADTNFFTLPIMQVIGVFKGNVSLSSLNILFNKVLYKRVDVGTKGLIKDVGDNTTVGEVVKVGTCRFGQSWKKSPLMVKPRDLILVKDNISTEIILDGETYYAVEEEGIVGIFNDHENLSLNSMTFLNDIILMTPYIPEKMSSKSLLWTPVMNYEDLDYSEIYCRNRFKVAYLDENLTKIKKDDIVIIDRNVTTYVYFNRQKYYAINGMDYIEGRRL